MVRCRCALFGVTAVLSAYWSLRVYCLLRRREASVLPNVQVRTLSPKRHDLLPESPGELKSSPSTPYRVEGGSPGPLTGSWGRVVWRVGWGKAVE